MNSRVLTIVILFVCSGCSLWRELLPPLTVSDLVESEARWWQRRSAWEDAQKQKFAWVIGKNQSEVTSALGRPTEIITADQFGGGTLKYGADERWAYSKNDPRYRSLPLNFLNLYFKNRIVVDIDVF